MLEEKVEDHLRKLVTTAGGFCVKLNPLGYVGIPDRMVLLPGGQLAFVELKRPKGGVFSTMQDWWRDKLIELGFRYERVSTLYGAEKLVLDLTAG